MFQGASQTGSGGQDSTPPNPVMPAPAIPLNTTMLRLDDLPSAIVDLKQAEIAYKASAKLIQVADEMQGELLKALD